MGCLQRPRMSKNVDGPERAAAELSLSVDGKKRGKVRSRAGEEQQAEVCAVGRPQHARADDGEGVRRGQEHSWPCRLGAREGGDVAAGRPQHARADDGQERGVGRSARHTGRRRARPRENW